VLGFQAAAARIEIAHSACVVARVVETHSYTKSIIITCVAAAPSKAASAFFISPLYTTGDAW